MQAAFYSQSNLVRVHCSAVLVHFDVDAVGGRSRDKFRRMFRILQRCVKQTVSIVATGQVKEMKNRKRSGSKTFRTLRIEQIRLDFQPTENLFEERVFQLMLELKDGIQFKPIIVRFDGTHYFCQDGFHRIEATKRLGRKKIKVEVSPGTLADMEHEFRQFLEAVKKKLQPRPSETGNLKKR